MDSSPISALAALVVGMALVALARLPSPRPVTFAKEPAVRLSPGARALRDGRGLDLNRATAEDLRLLPRIGPALAARIVEGRPYRSVEDLVRVRGIGPRTLERLRPLVRVEPGARLGATAGGNAPAP